jgi:hypothetical protein
MLRLSCIKNELGPKNPLNASPYLNGNVMPLTHDGDIFCHARERLGSVNLGLSLGVELHRSSSR